MKVNLNLTVVVICLRILIGALFVYAGTAKIGDPQSFADSIETFKLLSPGLINLMALALPILEIVAGLFLLLGFKSRSTYLVLLLLTACFILALTQGLLRGLELDCGCFGNGQPSAARTIFSLVRNFILVTILAWLYLREIGEAGAHT